MTKKTKGYFISIGGGKNQLPLIQTSNDLNLMVITVDKNDLAPGFEQSQVKILESTHEYRKVLNALEHIPFTTPIVAVGCRSFGKANYTAAYIADKLKLPGSPPRMVRLFLNKKSYLEKLAKFGLRIPTIYNWESKSELNKLIQQLPYPLILKPVSGSGKKGIEFFNNQAELKTRINKEYPDPDKNILQDYIHGSEITVLGFVDQEGFHLLSASDKWTTSYPPFLEKAHSLPTEHTSYLGEIHVYMNNIAKHLGLKNTALLAEFKIDQEGNLYLLEAAPEVGGEYIADHLIPAYYGINYFQIFTKLLLGDFSISLLPKPPKINHKACVVYSIPPEDSSTVTSLEKFTTKNYETLVYEENLKEVGFKANIKNGNHCRPKVVVVSTELPISTKDLIKDVELRLGVEYK